jgi:WhiB family redox-sensing transcriptional regulator
MSRDVEAASLALVWPDGRQWLAFAACAGASTELFYRPDGQASKEALRICRDCAVRVECLTFAMANNEWSGVWGGMDAASRRRLKTHLRSRWAHEERIDG